MELIIITAITLLFVIFMIFIGQKLLISSILRPQKHENILESENKPNEEFYSGEKKFTILSQRQHNISCLYVPLTDTGEPPEKLVIFLHANNGKKEDMKKYLPIFRKLGFSAIFFDSRFCGESGGTELGLSVVEAEDLDSIFSWIHDCYGDIPTGLFGESFGAVAALLYASKNKVSFVISNSAFSDLHLLLKERLRADYRIGEFPMLTVAEMVLKRKYQIDVKSASPLKLMKKGLFNIDVPIFFIHGENDTYILPQMSIDLYNAKNGGYKKFWLISEAGHLEGFENNYEEFETKMKEFFKKIVKK